MALGQGACQQTRSHSKTVICERRRVTGANFRNLRAPKAGCITAQFHADSSNRATRSRGAMLDNLIGGKPAWFDIYRHRTFAVEPNPEMNFLPDRKLVKYVWIGRKTMPENITRVTFDEQEALAQRVDDPR
jgi:hypothetical protein